MSASCSIEPDSRKIGQHRFVIGARFDGARELRQGDHGHFELAGQALQRAGDVADLLHPVLALVVAAHQLQIVHDDQVQAVLGLQAARLGAQLQRRHGGRVVDEEHRARQLAGCRHQHVPLVVLDLAQAQPLLVDAGLGRQEALHQLLGAHFQAEEGDDLA